MVARTLGCKPGERTIYIGDNIGIMENEMETTRVDRDSIGYLGMRGPKNQG